MSHPVAGRRRGSPRRQTRHHLAAAVLCALASALAPGAAAASPELDAARAAAERIGQRLERIRDPAIDPPRIDLDLRMAVGEDEREYRDYAALTPEPADPRFRTGGVAQRPAGRHEMHLRTSGIALDAYGYWSRGEVGFAPASGLGWNAASLTSGYDWSGSAQRIAGFTAGFDRRPSDEGGAASVTGYGSLSPLPSTFVDVVAGTSGAADDAGSRAVLYGSARFGIERRFEGWLINPYGRAELSEPVLRENREPQGRVTAGLRAEKRLQFGAVGLRPQLRWESERAIRPGASETPRSQAITPALLLDIGSDWTARIEHRSRFDEGSHAGRLEVRLTGRW